MVQNSKGPKVYTVESPSPLSIVIHIPPLVQPMVTSSLKNLQRKGSLKNQRYFTDRQANARV